MEIRIGDPARKHGIPDEDMLHAVRYARTQIDTIDEDMPLIVGPGRDGNFLEIGILDLDGDDPVIMHAMKLRRKFNKYL